MIRYLLDTNVISEVRKNRPHGAVVAWLSGLEETQVFFSAVTLGELQSGIELIRQQDAVKAREIEMWVDQLESTFQVLAMDSACFREWVRMMHRKSAHLAQDAMIAATARVHDLTVATRNETDFRHFAVKVVNPFES